MVVDMFQPVGVPRLSESGTENSTLSLGVRGFQWTGHLPESREARAMNRFERTRPRAPARSEPCTPLRAHQIRRQCWREPRHGFGAMPFGRNADREYDVPLP